MNIEQTEIQERMRNRAMSQLMNAFVAFKQALATQGHDTTALTLEAVMAIIEPPQQVTIEDVTAGEHHAPIRSTRKAK
jgi:hypothetical protein